MNKLSRYSLILFFCFSSANIFAADIIVDSEITSQQSFSENDQTIFINSDGNIAVTGADNGIFSNTSRSNLGIEIDAASDKGISAESAAVSVTNVNGFTFNLNSGRITSNNSNSGSNTVFLYETHGTSSLNLAAETLIENTATSGSKSAVRIDFQASNDYDFTVNNSGTILGRDGVESYAIDLFNDSSATNRLFTINNNGGTISAGDEETNTAIFISGSTKTIINNSNSGSIVGGISGNSTLKEIDITNSTSATITGDIDLKTHAGSSVTITGGSITGDLTFGNSAQTLSISGSGSYLLGTINGTGVITIGSESSLNLNDTTLSATVNGALEGNGAIVVGENQTVTTNTNIGSSTSLATVFLMENSTLDLADNNNSIDATNIYIDEDATIEVGTATINGDITGNISIGVGTINFNENNILGGNIGVEGFKVNQVNILANKTLDGAGDNNIFANTISLADGATLDLSAGGDIIGAVSLSESSSIILGAGSNVSGSINGTSNDKGNLTIGGGIVIIESAIGNSHNLSSINISEGAQARFTENFSASDIEFSGQIDLEKTSGNTITGNLATSGSSAALRIYGRENIVNGNMTLGSGTTIIMDINDVENAGSIVATGIASLAENLVLRVFVSSGDTSTGSSYVIASGGDGSSINAVTENNIKINNSDVNTFGNLRFTTSVSENQLILLVSSINPLGQNPNQRGLYNHITNLSSASGNLLTIKNLLESESDNGAASQILNSLSPQTDSSSNRLSFANVSDSANLTSQRLNTLHSGISSGDESVKKSSWAQTFGSKINQGNNSTSQGYKASSYGFAVGYDHEIADDTILGLSLSYANSSINSIDKLKKTYLDSYQFNLYGGKSFENFFINAMIGFAHNQYNSYRRISAINNTAAAKYSGQTYIAKAEIGNNYKINNHYILTPTFALTAARNRINDYSESGAGNAGLEVENNDTNFFEARIGSEISRIFKISAERTIRPNFSLSYGYDFAGSKQRTSSRFIGQSSSFASASSNMPQGSLRMGTGLRLFYKDSFTFDLDYAFDQRIDYQAHSGSLKAKYEF